ncbi:hypothetical protein [Candidatus Palauibacter soopunensis]|uniref:hypothetical protein n=1 Tax=Candidatus Palauibacter soopunensis TaxID=3056739 RepID=UPI00239D1B19|nr:hypothetical protein [Candidatus Palauibacter soopunensis]MDE2877377.1 hypothetical protein [Candidatus Palauibacter soopunensis]
MFELDTEVRKWRSGVEHRSSLSARELDELEDHLRARVDLELELDAALAPANAFATAVDELGEPSTISREFTRAGRPRWRSLLLAGWALYATSFLMPAFGYSSPSIDRTTYGYEIVPQLIQHTVRGEVLAVAALWLPNLILLLTLPAWRRRRPWRRAWTACIVGLTGALPLGLGLLRLGDAGPGFHSGVGFWVWCASFVVVATALWFRRRDWASAV